MPHQTNPFIPFECQLCWRLNKCSHFSLQKFLFCFDRKISRSIFWFGESNIYIVWRCLNEESLRAKIDCRGDKKKIFPSHHDNQERNFCLFEGKNSKINLSLQTISNFKIDLKPRFNFLRFVLKFYYIFVASSTETSRHLFRRLFCAHNFHLSTLSKEIF